MHSYKNYSSIVISENILVNKAKINIYFEKVYYVNKYCIPNKVNNVLESML